MPKNRADELFAALSAAMVGMIRRDGPDLTARGMAILMTIETTPGPHTVRGTADRLAISKPSVTRTLDRLEELGFARRDGDPADRRSVVVRATRTGSAYVRLFGRLAAVGVG